MKNLKLLLLFIISFLISVVGSAQSKKHEQLSKAVEQLTQLMINPDKDKLHDILADSLSYGHSGGKVEGKASLIHALLTAASDFVTIELSNQTIIISGKTGIVRHNLTGTTNDNNKPGSVKLNVLTVWQKEKLGWQLLARQAVKG